MKKCEDIRIYLSMGPMMKFYKQLKSFKCLRAGKCLISCVLCLNFPRKKMLFLYYTNYARSSTMADCHNIQALINGLFLRSFLYSFTNPSLEFVCRSVAVWIYQVGYLFLPNCFFCLYLYLIVNNVSQL